MDDLTGGPDARARQLAAIDGDPDAAWLRRQLEAALDAWARDETTIDIAIESNQDY